MNLVFYYVKLLSYYLFFIVFLLYLNCDSMIDIEKIDINKQYKDILIKYKLYLIHEENLEEKTTCDSYLYDIYKYLFFLEKKRIYDFKKIKVDNINEYISTLTNENYSVYSVVRKISSIKKFHHYLNKKYDIEDVSLKVENIHFYRNLPDILSIEEVDKLLNFPLENEFDYRNKAMIELMYGTGLRVSELVNLNLTDIDLENSYVRCFGKGSKTRIVPIGDIALKYLTIYH